MAQFELHRELHRELHLVLRLCRPVVRIDRPIFPHFRGRVPEGPIKCGARFEENQLERKSHSPLSTWLSGGPHQLRRVVRNSAPRARRIGRLSAERLCLSLEFGHSQPAKRAAACGPGWSAFCETLGIPLKKASPRSGRQRRSRLETAFRPLRGLLFSPWVPRVPQTPLHPGPHSLARSAG